MNTIKNKEFCIDSCEFISGLLEFVIFSVNDLSTISLSNYESKFKTMREAVARTITHMNRFTNKWESDNENICSTIKTLKEYYNFYCVTLNNSSPSTYRSDSKYIVDSFNTSKLALTCKLKKIINEL